MDIIGHREMEFAFGGGYLFSKDQGWNRVGMFLRTALILLKDRHFGMRSRFIQEQGEVFEPNGEFLVPTELRSAKGLRGHAWGLTTEPGIQARLREYPGLAIAGKWNGRFTVIFWNEIARRTWESASSS